MTPPPPSAVPTDPRVILDEDGKIAVTLGNRRDHRWDWPEIAREILALVTPSGDQVERVARAIDDDVVIAFSRETITDTMVREWLSRLRTALAPSDADEPIEFGYTNYRGEASTRRARVLGLRWGASEWHTTPQWLLLAWDVDKAAEREFAVADMRPIDAEPMPLTLKALIAKIETAGCLWETSNRDGPGCVATVWRDLNCFGARVRGTSPLDALTAAAKEAGIL